MQLSKGLSLELLVRRFAYLLLRLELSRLQVSVAAREFGLFGVDFLAGFKRSVSHLVSLSGFLVVSEEVLLEEGVGAVLLLRPRYVA